MARESARNAKSRRVAVLEVDESLLDPSADGTYILRTGPVTINALRPSRPRDHRFAVCSPSTSDSWVVFQLLSFFAMKKWTLGGFDRIQISRCICQAESIRKVRTVTSGAADTSILRVPSPDPCSFGGRGCSRIISHCVFFTASSTA